MALRENKKGKDFEAPVGNFCHICDDLIDFLDRCLLQTKSNQHAEGEKERNQKGKVRVSGKVRRDDKKRKHPECRQKLELLVQFKIY